LDAALREPAPAATARRRDRSKSRVEVKAGRFAADNTKVEPEWARCLLGPRRAPTCSAFHAPKFMSTPTVTTRFLVVDDFSTMRRILRNLLAEIGFRQVEEAGDGRAALELLRQGQVDFVISDINMPRIGGFELLRQIRADAALKDLPVLLITSEASKDDVLQAIRLGANGTILKPLTKSTLEEKVRNILLRSSAWPVGGARPPAKPAAQGAAAPVSSFLRAAPSARNA
jgi:two-component system chemotaxis response regulator CheY